MHIKQITISNFRSFRQQPEIHPFASTTNCVLGRNGSGKSNLFDAVQFVLLAPRFATLRSVCNSIQLTVTVTVTVFDSWGDALSFPSRWKGNYLCSRLSSKLLRKPSYCTNIHSCPSFSLSLSHCRKNDKHYCTRDQGPPPSMHLSRSSLTIPTIVFPSNIPMKSSSEEPSEAKRTNSFSRENEPPNKRSNLCWKEPAFPSRIPTSWCSRGKFRVFA